MTTTTTKKKPRQRRTATLPDGRRVTLEPPAGRVKFVNGRAHVCEAGIAIRMGLARPEPETAAALYPLFELAEGEERPEPGEIVDDVPVFAWLDQAAAAKVIGLTTRQVANLEVKGLPSKGHRSTKRYPLPHALVWIRVYYRRGGAEGRVSRLPFRVAWADEEAWLAREALKIMEATA